MTNEVEDSFEIIMKKVIKAPTLPLPNFDMVFEIDCDALSQQHSLLSTIQVKALGFEIL